MAGLSDSVIQVSLQGDLVVQVDNWSWVGLPAFLGDFHGPGRAG